MSGDLAGYVAWLIGIVLLIWEYRANSSVIRVIATGLAATFVLLNGDLGPIVRGTLASDQRITTMGYNHSRITEYASGVLTMKRDAEAYLRGLWFPTAMLVWLAISPVFRRFRGRHGPKPREASAGE
jgi:hypothetical protein